MDTETMIRELNNVIEKHKNDFVPTFQVNIASMCMDIVPKLEKLKEYEDLEEQGKLLKLPCKVGDTLYFPYIDSVTKEKVISKEKVTEIGLYYRVGSGELSSCSEIGSIIFVEETDAENALQKMNEMEGKE